MNSSPTEFERKLIESIICQNSNLIPLNQIDCSSLEVLRREPTGVGAYITLSREKQLPDKCELSRELGFRGEIFVPGVPSGLGAVLDIDSGQLNYLELFTYGDEEWDGNTEVGDVVPETSST